MVEGPGATRNGRKAQFAVGFVVESISVASDNRSVECLRGKTLTCAFVVGKELFFIFNAREDESTSECESEVAIRLHFGMNGSLHCGKTINVPSWKQKNGVASIRMVLVDSVASASNRNITDYYEKVDTSTTASQPAVVRSKQIIIEARETTVSGMVSAKAARAKLSRLHCRDSCSSSFDARQVFTAIRKASGRNQSLMICDAVLNQDLFPGVGNIIKIEALHRAKVDPRRWVSSLADEELRRVVLHCRRYSICWLEKGRAPEKMVYNKITCGTCNNTSVSMQKMGGKGNANGSNANAGSHAYMSRTTFWCKICQPIKNVRASAGVGVGLATSQQALKSAMETLNANQPTLSCPQHGVCMLRRVRKVGSPNISRVFRICKVKNCQYFSWADGHFPVCRCGNNKKVILRISKTERSGGRWFLSCSQGDKRIVDGNNRGCGFFQWAEPEVLAPFGSSLTPLL